VTGSPSIPRRIANWIGWAVLVAGALLALLLAGPIALGDHPHTDLSGSMEPVISPGDVVMDEQIAPWEAKVGDIVTFRDPEEESKLLTHRVVKIHDEGSTLRFVTQGDANNTQEHWQVPATGQIGRVMYTVPWVGHVAVFARTRLGWMLMIGIPLLLIAAEEMFRIWRPRTGSGEGKAAGGTG
jgi:signal peptidase I